MSSLQIVPVTGGSLFSGIGGLEIGAHVAGLDVDWRWQVEQEPFCRRVLSKHFTRTDRSVTDVCDAGAHNLDSVDVICGGFPCQDISLAGKGAGLAGKRSGLWREFARIISEIRPRVVVVENVLALVSRGLADVLADFAALGFDAEWADLRASDVGAPHRRARLFVVAWRVPDPVGERVRLTEHADRRIGEEMADPERNGPQSERVSGLLDGERAPQRDDADRRGGEEMADPERNGLQGEQQTRAEARAARRRHTWPPGPDARDVWARLPQDAQPSVCRGAHGLPAGVLRDRRRRLKALGNAVCPQQAAIVWRRVAEVLA